MERENVKKLLAMMQGAYPNFNPSDKTVTTNVWTIALKDYGENEVISAFKTYLKTNSSGFAPSPGQLIEEICQETHKDELSVNAAWDLVINAISDERQRNANGGYLTLPDIVQRAIGGRESFSKLKWMDDEERAREKHAFAKCYQDEVSKKRREWKLSRSGNAKIEKKNVECHKMIE